MTTHVAHDAAIAPALAVKARADINHDGPSLARPMASVNTPHST